MCFFINFNRQKSANPSLDLPLNRSLCHQPLTLPRPPLDMCERVIDYFRQYLFIPILPSDLTDMLM